MKKTSMLSTFVLTLAGCVGTIGQLGDSPITAVKCAKNWEAQGFQFDPNSMTCSQMFERVQAARRIDYWTQRGYKLDPNLATWQQVDERAKAIDRASYWITEGYDFDPSAMTVQEMDKTARELAEVKYWAKLGYYYDPNTRVVYLYKGSKTRLSSVPSVSSGGYGSHSFSDPSYYFPSSAYSTYSGSTSHLNLSPSALNQRGSIGARQYSIGTPTNYGTYLGQLSANEFAHQSTSNPFGAGSQFDPHSVNNEFGQYGSEFSPYSAHNPFATQPPKLYDSQGNYRGKLSSNPFDPDSVSNPFGRYGSRFSPDSINNPFGAGNPLSHDSPTNAYGSGLSIYADD